MYCWNYMKKTSQVSNTSEEIQELPQNYSEEKGKAFDFKLSSINETQENQ